MSDPASLKGLYDIVHFQESWIFPLAPAWYILGFFLLLMIAKSISESYRKWKRNSYRRQGEQELNRLFENIKRGDCSLVLNTIAIIMKSTAMKAYGRENVAPLSGQEWLLFLDDTGRTRDFTLGDGAILNNSSYRSREWINKLSQSSVENLLKVSLHWIRTHREGDNLQC